MKKIFIYLLLLPVICFAQQDSVLSAAYNWQQPAIKKNNITSVVLLEGKVHDFEWMQLSAYAVIGSKKIKQTVPSSQEQVIIMKSGSATINFGDSSFLLTPNSVAVLMPGENYTILAFGNEACNYYIMKYRSRSSMNINKLPISSSYVKLWESAAYKPNTIGGGRRDFFERGTTLQKRFEMHVSTLKEGLRSHEPHTHRAEEIVLVIEGDTEMQIGQQFYKTNPGGFYYLGSNMLHAIKNTGTKPSTYFAIQFE